MTHQLRTVYHTIHQPTGEPWEGFTVAFQLTPTAVTPHASASTRAATTITADYAGTIEHIFCRYSEDFGATWQTASLTAEGAIGTYGSIDLTDDVLTIASTRALMIRDLVIYDRELTDTQQAAVVAAIANGTFGD